MVYDPTKPAVDQGAMGLVLASVRENFEAFRLGLVKLVGLNVEGDQAIIDRTIPDNSTPPQGVAWFGVSVPASAAIGTGPATLYFADVGATRFFLARAAAAFSATGAGAETGEYLIMVRTPTDTSAANAVTAFRHDGIRFMLETFRVGSESGNFGAQWVATAASQRFGARVRFRHKRLAVPTITLTAGTATANISARNAFEITVDGFLLALDSAAAGAAFDANGSFATSA